MMNELQSFIYTEKLLSELYRKAASLEVKQLWKNTYLTFSADATQNMNLLNYLYRLEYGTNYDPMIPDTVATGTYREVLNEILSQELGSFLQYRKMTYNQQDMNLKEAIRAISDTKLGHIITILAILTELNKPVEKVQ